MERGVCCHPDEAGTPSSSTSARIQHRDRERQDEGLGQRTPLQASLSEAQGEGVMGDVPGEPTSYGGRPVTPRGRTGFMYNRAD